MKATFQSQSQVKLIGAVVAPNQHALTMETLILKLSGHRPFPTTAELISVFSREELQFIAYREWMKTEAWGPFI